MTARRTLKESAADELDLEVFRLARRIETFAEKYVPSHERAPLRNLVTAIKSGRHHIRKYMSRKDAEETQ